jgi:hypothetical protein
MTEINHFENFAFFSGDVVMIEQLRWIAHILRELIEPDLFI